MNTAAAGVDRLGGCKHLVGVGDVNTWPGQAASSMPWPTKPACSGS
jgi:hypothetical protein